MPEIGIGFAHDDFAHWSYLIEGFGEYLDYELSVKILNNCDFFKNCTLFFFFFY